MRLYRPLFLAILLIIFVTPLAHAKYMIDADEKSAVILAYSRIDEDNYPQTSLRFDEFETHIQELIHGEYNIASLPDIIRIMKNGEKLPPKTIAITFEGGYKSALDRAIPLLFKLDIPFTIFFATDNAEISSGEYMDWPDIKSLQRNKNISFGILPALYQRVTEQNTTENRRLLNKAVKTYRDFFKTEPKLFSYPFGQYTRPYKELIEEQNFDAAFGLQSGVAYSGMDFYNIPRFTITDGFGSIERFKTIANAFPIPAKDIEPQNHVLKDDEPLFGFSLDDKDAEILNGTSCFISGQGKAILQRPGLNRLEIRPKFPLDNGRVRINCTANSGTTDAPKWRWFGMLYTIDTLRNYTPKTQQDEPLQLQE